jgi:hypothetical protein
MKLALLGALLLSTSYAALFSDNENAYLWGNGKIDKYSLTNGAFVSSYPFLSDQYDGYRYSSSVIALDATNRGLYVLTPVDAQNGFYDTTLRVYNLDTFELVQQGYTFRTGQAYRGLNLFLSDSHVFVEYYNQQTIIAKLPLNDLMTNITASIPSVSSGHSNTHSFYDQGNNVISPFSFESMSFDEDLTVPSGLKLTQVTKNDVLIFSHAIAASNDPADNRENNFYSSFRYQNGALTLIKGEVLVGVDSKVPAASGTYSRGLYLFSNYDSYSDHVHVLTGNSGYMSNSAASYVAKYSADLSTQSGSAFTVPGTDASFNNGGQCDPTWAIGPKIFADKIVSLQGQQEWRHDAQSTGCFLNTLTLYVCKTDSGNCISNRILDQSNVTVAGTTHAPIVSTGSPVNKEIIEKTNNGHYVMPSVIATFLIALLFGIVNV